MTGGRSRHPAPAPAAEQTPIPVPSALLTPGVAAEEDSDADLQSAWKEFDPTLKSSISGAQFRQLMAGLGENVSDKEVDELIGRIDGDEKISCELYFLRFDPS